uniref:Reverse transcriptase domain-containing protein n=1 Tax=Solanum tuberosum TaxID=4113 RepID=M1B0E1_SOLTU
MKNRQITDASMIANEVLDWKLKSGESGILCKLNIKKDFDQLNWAYLINILKQMGFRDRWIRWIFFCISTVKLSVLVNRSLVGFFSSKKGLRQGDPLFSFLFILAMEGLSQMLTKAKELQWIQGLQVGSDPSTTLTVPHLLYADDTLIFCGADSQQISNLNITLMVFEFISGLHINMLKSIIYPVNEVSNPRGTS